MSAQFFCLFLARPDIWVKVSSTVPMQLTEVGRGRGEGSYIEGVCVWGRGGYFVLFFSST